MNKNELQKLLHSLKPNEIVDKKYNDELILYFSRHPCWDEKKGCGVDFFFKAKNEFNYSFHIKRKDNTSVSISINFPLKINRKQLFNKAFRNEILYQILDFKKTIKYGVDKCIFTNEILTEKNSHIDHFDLEFKDVFELFIKNNNINFDKHFDYLIGKKGAYYFIQNEKCRNSWQQFHKENTNLRCILAKINLTRK